jgi:hypothetical protein
LMVEREEEWGRVCSRVFLFSSIHNPSAWINPNSVCIYLIISNQFFDSVKFIWIEHRKHANAHTITCHFFLIQLRSKGNGPPAMIYYLGRQSYMPTKFKYATHFKRHFFRALGK